MKVIVVHNPGMLPKLHEFLSTLPQNGSLILLIIPPNYPNTRRITCVRFGISAAKAIRSSRGLFLWAVESGIRGNAQGRESTQSMDAVLLSIL